MNNKKNNTNHFFFYNFLKGLTTDVSNNDFNIKKIIPNETNINYRNTFKNKSLKTTLRTRTNIRFKWLNSILFNPKFTYLLINFFMKKTSNNLYNSYNFLKFCNAFTSSTFPNLNMKKQNKPLQYNLNNFNFFSKDYNFFNTCYVFLNDRKYIHNFNWKYHMNIYFRTKCFYLLNNSISLNKFKSFYEKDLFKLYSFYVAPLKKINLLSFFKKKSMFYNDYLDRFTFSYFLNRYNFVSYVLPYFFYWYYYDNTEYRQLKKNFFFYSKSFFSLFSKNLKYVFSLFSFYKINNMKHLHTNNNIYYLPNKYYKYFYSSKKLSFFNNLFYYYRQSSWYSFKSLFYDYRTSLSFIDKLLLSKKKTNYNSYVYDYSFFFFDKLKSFNTLDHIDNKYLYLLKKKMWRQILVRRKELKYKMNKFNNTNQKQFHIVNMKTIFFDYINNFFSFNKSSLIDVNINYFFSPSLYKYQVFILKENKFFFFKDYFLLIYKCFIYHFFYSSGISTKNTLLMLRDSFNYKEFFFFFLYFYKKKKIISGHMNELCKEIYNKLYTKKRNKLLSKVQKNTLFDFSNIFSYFFSLNSKNSIKDRLYKLFKEDNLYYDSYHKKEDINKFNIKDKNIKSNKEKLNKKTVLFNNKHKKVNFSKNKTFQLNNKINLKLNKKLNNKLNINKTKRNQKLNLNKHTKKYYSKYLKNTINKQMNNKSTKNRSNTMFNKIDLIFNKKTNNKNSIGSKSNIKWVPRNQSNMVSKKDIKWSPRNKNHRVRAFNNRNNLYNQTNIIKKIYNINWDFMVRLHKKNDLNFRWNWFRWKLHHKIPPRMSVKTFISFWKKKINNFILSIYLLRYRKLDNYFKKQVLKLTPYILKVVNKQQKKKFKFNKIHNTFSISLFNSLINKFNQYDLNTFKLNKSFFEYSLSKKNMDYNYFKKKYNKKKTFSKLIYNYFNNYKLMKKKQSKCIDFFLNSFFFTNKKTRFSFYTISKAYIKVLNIIRYSTFKLDFLKNRVSFFIDNLRFSEEKKWRKKILFNDSLKKQKKFYNYEFRLNNNNLTIYEGSSINIFYSQLFSMINYFFFFIKQCCFVHFLGDTFSEYKSLIIIFNLTSPLFIISNNLYNFSFMEWFFNLNLKDYF